LSPVDGVVISRAVDVGQTVASSFNTPTLFQIANDLTKMQIDSSIAEADIGSIVENQSVDFTVDAYPYRTFRGVVTQVRNSPITVNNVVTYDTVIGLTNADYKLKPGMTANVSIVIAHRENALRVPNAALRFHPVEPLVAETNAAPPVASAPPSGGPHQHGGGLSRWRGGSPNKHTVYVLQPDKTLQAVQIKTGISDGIYTEVTDGLKENDQVVTGSSSSYDQTSATSSPFGGGGGGFPRMR
jgi:HlyD family secretion protein